MADDPSPPRPSGPTAAIVRPSASLRAAWLTIGSVAAVVGVAFATLQVLGLLAHEERDEAFRIADPAVAVLDVGSDTGRVEVTGADVDHIQVDAHVSDGLVATRFSHEVVGDRLQVRVRCRAAIADVWCGADLRIVVPRGLEVKVRSRNGSVALRSLTGRVDAESSNGSVEAEGVAGSTRLHSDNGSVRGTRLRSESIEADSDNGSVRLELAVAPRSVIARSDNGDVDIALPRDEEGYAVAIDSGHGHTDDLVLDRSESTRRIVARSDNGSVTVRYLD